MHARRVRARPAAMAGALAVALALAGCLHDDGEPRPAERLTVYVSTPSNGPSGRDGRDAADGARLALAEAEHRAGPHPIRAVFLDSTEGQGARARSSPAQVGRNARRATRDASAIAYIGELDSGATRTSLPITNEARILQVAPGSPAEDLVREPGTFDGVPTELQPTGERSFGRVVPSDIAQARAGARWAGDLARRIAVIVEGSSFGRTAARAFVEEAHAEGLRVDRFPLERLDETLGGTAGPGAVEGRCADGDPPDVSLPRGAAYFAGEDPRALAIFGCQLRLPGPFLATDALLPYVGELRGEQLVNRVLLTSAAQDPSQLPPAGRDLVERFRKEHGRDPGRYAAYGYEAMAVVLDSIDRAGDGADRAEVIEAFLATAERDSVLGSYSIASTGETTLDRIGGYRVERGRAVPVAVLRPSGR